MLVLAQPMRDLSGRTMNRRLRIVACICLAGFLEAIIYGLSFPYFSVRLERAGLSPSLIGLNATLGAAGVLFCGRMFPGLIRRYGYRAFSAGCFAGALASIASLLASDAVTAWFGLRLLLGVCLGGLWAATEGWLNHVAEDAYRGRANAVFQALYSLGFFLGPLGTYVTGYDGHTAILVMMAICGVALLVLVAAGRSVPGTGDEEDTPIRWRDLARLSSARTIMLLAVLVGVCETAVYALLPVYGIHQGLTTRTSVGVLVAYTLGEVVVALPLGWLADRVPRERILVLSATGGAVSLLLLPLAIHGRYEAWALALIAGGMVVNIYNIALVLIGERFGGADLPLLSTAFSMAYALGSMGGSTVGGAAMDVFGPNGLPLAIGGALACVGAALTVQLVRGPRRREVVLAGR
jgi:MFS family permease